MNSKPTIGITMGDAAGIGPEIIVKALARPDIRQICRPIVIGDAAPLERAIALLGSELRIKRIETPDEDTVIEETGSIPLIDLGLLHEAPAYGFLSAEAGNAAYHYIERAVKLGLEGSIAAICTAPLNKEALHLGGHRFPGHTEILAELMGVKDYAMMLSAPNLRVIHVTTHVGIIDAIAMINPERVLRVIQLAHDILQESGMQNPRIAVCGINPHAGEGGLFGRGEEAEKIIPAVQQAVEAGILAYGPLPADTLFFRAVRGDFDMVVAMYHDQGHGPVKVLGLDAGVNITVGLPVVRTSVDHGTAFDIAGKGIADESSLVEALRQAVMLAPLK
ncbi:4-hydroxythreonine-4-phosphate dehydrogenase PdxA [Paenibacillus psychroresistens]|uniref:4-hydroxythreonine-4-phosphate dehydrogenase PdxA n=1 Tax=Paenibacillus psychroresistens TaxID=1778678 RepID=A0A6B8RVL1_9BACL|nr:4-hydroxythreonine-4-phosphate dehydrogenase PdxA [Paenibacillus psychroresistens]QGQ99473.1 4-hydroxythreonine-4-phosphate dehydrogenase PdxA [Paenibacillus psychroresistens]